MSYFVYHDSGSCEMGNHIGGLEEFDTLEEAVAFAKETKEDTYHGDNCTIEIIHGSCVASTIPDHAS